MTRSEKACAFCGSTSNELTKEHIIPRFIIDRRTEKWDTFSARNKSFFQGDPQIGDVCAKCNSGRLSALDAYASTLWDRYFENIVMAGEIITFQYDFARLARWLLKVSFNSCRASNNERDAAVLRRYLPYIMGESSHRPLAIYLELMTPYFLSPEEERRTDPLHLEKLPRDKRGRVMLEPREIRPATGAKFTEMTVRLLALQSYYFRLLLATKEVPESHWKRLRREARDQMPAAKYLPEDEGEVRIPASKANFIESKVPTFLTNKKQFKQRRDDYVDSLHNPKRERWHSRAKK